MKSTCLESKVDEVEKQGEENPDNGRNRSSIEELRLPPSLGSTIVAMSGRAIIPISRHSMALKKSKDQS